MQCGDDSKLANLVVDSITGASRRSVRVEPVTPKSACDTFSTAHGIRNESAECSFHLCNATALWLHTFALSDSSLKSLV